MKRFVEPAAWFAVLGVLATLVWGEGRERARLERQLPVEPRDLYRSLARSQTALQVVDVRGDLTRYEDAHVPGSVPMPGCELAQAPETARHRIDASVPTVLVGGSGGDAEASLCARRFTTARTLAGGMEAWSDANLPEDSGVYSPPSVRAGGGCL